MTRTQILIPDELYERARSYADTREISMAEIIRRGLEMFLNVTATTAGATKPAKWQPPKIRDMGTKCDPFEDENWRYELAMGGTESCSQSRRIAEAREAYGEEEPGKRNGGGRK